MSVDGSTLLVACRIAQYVVLQGELTKIIQYAVADTEIQNGRGGALINPLPSPSFPCCHSDSTPKSSQGIWEHCKLSQWV